MDGRTPASLGDAVNAKGPAPAGKPGSVTSEVEQLFGFLVHELQQPLASVAFTAASARSQLDMPTGWAIREVKRKLEQAGALAARMGEISQMIAQFAAQQMGEAESLDLAELVEGVLAIVAPSMEQAGVTVTAELPEGLPLVRVQRVASEQVLTNLLLNARDALQEQPAGSRVIRITAEALADPGTIRIEIADSGPGILPAIRSRIFDPFFTTKGPQKGTGLGLALSAALITAMNGRIELAETGPGATFRLELPAETTSADQRPERSAPAGSAPLLGGPTLGEPLRASAVPAHLREPRCGLPDGVVVLPPPDVPFDLMQGVLAMALAINADPVFATKSGRARLEGFFLAYCAFAKANPEAFDLAIISLRHLPDEARDLTVYYLEDGQRRSIIAPVIMILDALACARGVARSEIPWAHNMACWATGHGVAGLVRRGEWELDDPRVAQTISSGLECLLYS